MLEKTSTRKIFKRVKDDTSSLYVQRDSTSIYSRCTDNLSKISKMFEFDRELFISKVYEKALRGSLKDTVENMRREQQQPYVIVTPEERKRNKLIERELEEHAKKLRRECKVLLLGDRDCAQTFIKSMKIAHSSGFTHEEREKYQKVVMNNIMLVMKGMAWILKNGDIDLDDTAKMHAKVLSQEIEKIQTGDGKITIEGAGAVQGLWKDKQFVKRLLNYEVYISDSSP
jgi:guanine nucleotide-binding protein G(i) subunit alpha